jgi:hypothetical protein
LPFLSSAGCCAARGTATQREKAFFVGNLLMAWAMAFLQFGYPALIVPALAVASSYIAFMVYFTAGDLRTVRADE